MGGVCGKSNIENNELNKKKNSTNQHDNSKTNPPKKKEEENKEKINNIEINNITFEKPKEKKAEKVQIINREKTKEENNIKFEKPKEKKEEKVQIINREETKEEIFQKVQKNENQKPKKKVEKISEQEGTDFELFFNQETKLLDQDGLEKIGSFLNIDIYTDMFFPYFLYKCKVKKLENISLEEYNVGLNFFRVSSIKYISKNCWKKDINSDDFKGFYNYLFELNSFKKMVSYEIIEVYFLKLFENIFFVKDFVSFLKKTNKEGLNKDQWICFLDFIKQYQYSFPKGYLVDDSWPVLFDEFYYEYCRNHNISYEKKNEDSQIF